MNCSEVSSKLGGFTDRIFRQAEMQAIEEHLKICIRCSGKLAEIARIDELTRAMVYPEPKEEYWSQIAGRVIHRLGLHDTQPASNFSNFVKRARTKLRDWVSPRPIAWGIVGAAAIVVLIVTSSRILQDGGRVEEPMKAEETVSQSSLPSAVVADEAPPAADAAVTTAADKDGQTEADPESSPSGLVAQQEEEADALKPADDAANPAVKADAAQVLSMSAVNPLPVRMPEQKTTPALRFDRIIYPIPNTEFLLQAIADAETDTENALMPIRTFALQQGQQPLPIFNPNENDELSDLESDFYETLWIVQEIKSLPDKRNIWLSYLSRESDPTYRSLAIFNLAIVMSQLVEETRDFRIAREALEFYTENEEGLRLQMGFQRYERKIQAFNLVITNH